MIVYVQSIQSIYIYAIYCNITSELYTFIGNMIKFPPLPGRDPIRRAVRLYN